MRRIVWRTTDSAHLAHILLGPPECPTLWCCSYPCQAQKQTEPAAFASLDSDAITRFGFGIYSLWAHARRMQAVLISIEPSKAEGDMAFTPPVVCPICRKTLELDRTLEDHLVGHHTHQEVASYITSLHERIELLLSGTEQP